MASNLVDLRRSCFFIRWKKIVEITRCPLSVLCVQGCALVSPCSVCDDIVTPDYLFVWGTFLQYSKWLFFHRPSVLAIQARKKRTKPHWVHDWHWVSSKNGIVFTNGIVCILGIVSVAQMGLLAHLALYDLNKRHCMHIWHCVTRQMALCAQLALCELHKRHCMHNWHCGNFTNGIVCIIGIAKIA